MKKIFYLLFLTFATISCDEILLETDISEENVLLIAPVDDAQFYSTGITFTWEAVDNVTQYHIQIARPDFVSPLQIVTDNVVEANTYTTQLTPGNYEWRVQAINSGYETAYSTRSFTVVSNEDFQNNSVTLTLPNNNTITNTVNQNLVWQPVIGATDYEVQVVDALGTTVISQQSVSGTSLNYTFPEGNHQWKVRATNGEQYTLFASRSILVDITAPNTPQLTVPANLYNSSDNDVTFQWNRVSIAGSVEKDSIYIYTNSQLSILKYKNEESSPYNTSSLDDGTYYWFVKSFDAAGNTSQQSSVFSFTLN